LIKHPSVRASLTKFERHPERPAIQFYDTNPNEQDMDEQDMLNEEQDNVMEIQDQQADKLTSVSQLKPNFSAVPTNMTGRTYISELQKQLLDERDARKKLETDLDELKKISSEITSQLSLMQR